LEAELRNNFKYRIGAPALNRLNSLEDFLFEQREGHCERFASALALLLRMHNIPTRIGIGYVPGPASRFSDWRQVRFKDAHAWTEAWFRDKGWVILDATPGGGGDEVGFGITQLMESLDLVWYSHVVSFDGTTQREIIASSIQGMMAFSTWAVQNPALCLGLIAIGFLPALLRRRGSLFSKTAALVRREEVSGADHFYAQLLRTLARRGLHRAPQQTPLEFLDQLRRVNTPDIPQIEEITQAFCRSHYGENQLSPEEAERVRAALKIVEHSPG
jgi:protein-glutamine gamma-glutamyltransferase